MVITDAEFAELLRSFRKTACYFEAQATYALDYEAADFGQFLAGSPTPPSEISWWAPWLDQVAELTRQGRQITRVRVISEPPSDYQRWGLWALPWHARAGEQIRYMSRHHAEQIDLPLKYDWWLMDDEQVIRLRYTPDGRIISKELTTHQGTITRFRALRDLAVSNATTAEAITAALNER